MANQKALLYLSGWSGLGHADISALVGKTLSSAEQTLCGTLIQSVELHICQNTRRQFKISDTTYYETLDAGKRQYRLQNFPVSAVTKITLDGNIIYGNEDADDDTLTLGTDLFVYEDGRVIFGTSQSSGVDNRNALVIYYTIDQFWGEDAKLAVKRWVADMLLSREYGTKAVNSIDISGGLSMSFDSKSIPDYVNAVISNYKQLLA